MDLLRAHDQPWVFEDLADLLPDNGDRHEVVDGNLVVTPPPSQTHQLVAGLLVRALTENAPPTWIAVQELPLRLGTDGRVPDVAVIQRDSPWRDRSRPMPVGPEHFGLVVEVVSPRTAKTDRFFKPAEYAAAGIPCFWRVELDPEPVVHGFRLEHGVYVEMSPLPVPWGALALDLVALLA